MSDIIEIIDERERQKNKDRKKQTSGAIVNVWELKGFVLRVS